MRRTGRALRRGAAFTLVEVLAAMLLVAVVLPVAMEGVSLATNASDDAKQRLEAAALAEQKLSDLVATGEWDSSTLSGDFGDDHPGYTWAAELNTSWSTKTTTLTQLTVTVSWTSRARPRTVVLSTLLYEGTA